MSKELIGSHSVHETLVRQTQIDAARIEELERDLLNLVCRIHRDGGHYIAKYGEAKAIADADTVAAQNNADLDALQADNARLREGLDEAATSLETIQLRSYGDESYLNHMDQVRGFAGSRSRVAKEALATTPDDALAAVIERVKEQCAHEGWMAASSDCEDRVRAAIRALVVKL